jgi:hypothetical protein
MDPALWTKPRQVAIEDGRLVADLAGGTPYPLTKAVEKGRALRAFVRVRNDDDARVFTETWGLLYLRFENGRGDTFPLDCFYAERRYLIDLTDVSAALRSGDTAKIAEALRVCAASKRALTSDWWSDPYEADLNEEEKHIVAQGYPSMDVLLARYTGQLMTPMAYAGRLLAEELHQPRRLEFARENRESRLHEVLDLRALNQALRWTLRTQYRVLHHIICEGCGNDAVVRRADGRYCQEGCGGRVRAQRRRDRRG